MGSSARKMFRPNFSMVKRISDMNDKDTIGTTAPAPGSPADIEDLKRVCGELYDIVKGNMLKAGGSISLPKEEFLLAMCDSAKVLNLEPVANAGNREFFEYVCKVLFNDTPTVQMSEHWEPMLKSLPKGEFRKRFMSAALNAMESSGRKVIIKGRWR